MPSCPIMHSGLSYHTPRCFSCDPSCTAVCLIIHRGTLPMSHHAQRHPSCPIMHSGLCHHTPRCPLSVPSCTAVCPIIHRGTLPVSRHAQRPVPSYTALRSTFLQSSDEHFFLYCLYSNANNKLGLNNRQGFLIQMKNLLNKVQWGV